MITLSDPPLAINVLIEDPKITKNPNVNWDKLSLDKKHVIVPIRPFSDKKLRSRIATAKPVPLDAPTLLSTPSRVVTLSHFPLQPAFAMTVDKAQGQTIDRVIVALSKRQLAITDFQYACLYVAVSRVKQRQHLRILLMEEDNDDLEWQSLLYINRLQRDLSIDAFFAGFDSDRSNWKSDVWNQKRAIAKLNATQTTTQKRKNNSNNK